MQNALELYEVVYPIKVKVMTARKKGLIEGQTLEELVAAAENASIITKEQVKQLLEYDKVTLDIINVDDFSEEELKKIH
jgi:transcriptional regulator